VACGVQQRYRHEQRRARVDKYVLNKGAKDCCKTEAEIYGVAVRVEARNLRSSARGILTHVSELAVPRVLPTSWSNALILEKVIRSYPEYFVIKAPWV
jgi:hypothetical protein